MPVPNEKQKKEMDMLSKAITDMYSGAKIEDILEAGWIVDSRGYPVKNEQNDEKNLQKIYDLVSAQGSDKKVYFQNVPSKENPAQEDTITFKLADDAYQPEVSAKSVTNVNVKTQALVNLSNVNEELKKYKGKNSDIKELKDNCEKLIVDLAEISDKEDFGRKLNEFSQSAERFYTSHAPASLNKSDAKNANLAYNIIKTKNDVLANKVPSLPDKIEEVQARIAAKYVSAYCMHTINKSTDGKAIEDAKDVLSKPSLFAGRVETTLKDPAFLYMYGSRKEGDEKDLLARLGDGLTSKVAKVFNKVEKERVSPSKERLEIEGIIKEAPPKRINARKQYESMSLQDQKPISVMVKSLREELDAIGGNNTSSPEFEKLRHELLVADIRLQRENSFMDVKKEMAELGDAVDEYVTKKMQEGKLNSRGLRRLNVAMRLRNLCDGVEKDKKPEDAVKSADETSKEILAERITKHLAKEMVKSDDSMIAKEGATINRNKAALAKASSQILNSDTFKEMFNDSSKLQNALEKNPVDVYNQICRQEFKKAEPEAIKKAKIEKTKIKEIKVEHEQEGVMIEMQNI